MNDKTSYRVITTERIESGEYSGCTKTTTTYHGAAALVASLERVRDYVDMALGCDGLTRELSEWLESIDAVASSALKGDRVTVSEIGRGPVGFERTSVFDCD